MIGYFLCYLTTLYQLQCLNRKCFWKYLDLKVKNECNTACYTTMNFVKREVVHSVIYEELRLGMRGCIPPLHHTISWRCTET
jgi:hypothetical protein